MFALRYSLLSTPRRNGQFAHHSLSTLLKERKKKQTKQPKTHLHTFRFGMLHVESASGGIWNGDDIMNCPHPY